MTDEKKAAIIEDDDLPDDEDVQAGDRNDVDAVTDLPIEDPTLDQTVDDEDLGEEEDG